MLKKNNSKGTRNTLRFTVGVLISAVFAVSLVFPTSASAGGGEENWVVGIRLRLGWKYDNLRMCGATGPGVPHGPDIDISAFAEVPIAGENRLDVNLPLFRPLLFAFGARMLQFEPEATLLFDTDEDDTRLVFGPSLGVSLNYGPDLNSTMEPEGRGPSFWSVGPRIGGYVGVDMVRPGERFNFQLGLHPYVAPLLSISDPENHRGLVIGSTLDGSFRFHPSTEQ